MDRDECEHGHLRRKCLICDLQEELAAERETTAWLRKEIEAWREREKKAESKETSHSSLIRTAFNACLNNEVSIIGEDGIKRTYRFNGTDWELIGSAEMVNVGRKCLICDLREELAAEQEHAADAEAESVKLLERLAAEREKKETAYREVEAQVRKVQKAEAACARIQEALHLVVGGPMPVTPDSLRELADFMEKQRDE